VPAADVGFPTSASSFSGKGGHIEFLEAMRTEVLRIDEE
jgi:hypothetical protein